jgi:hypothetical protein
VLASQRTPASAVPDRPTTDLSGRSPFPEPIGVISLRNSTTFRTVDEDGHPVLIITDGATTVALDCGLSGLSINAVTASRRLSEAIGDFATSIAAAWQGYATTPSVLRRRQRWWYTLFRR